MLFLTIDECVVSPSARCIFCFTQFQMPAISPIARIFMPLETALRPWTAACHGPTPTDHDVIGLDLERALGTAEDLW